MVSDSIRVRSCLAGSFAVILVLVVPGLSADTVTVFAQRDNTLYASTDGGISNGSGQHIFAGSAGSGGARRALVAFDVGSAIPAGSTIQSVELRLFMSRTTAGPSDVSVHRVIRDWGEGASDAEGSEGGGAASAPGDATWRHTFFDTEFWTTPGGDFAPAALAVCSVNAEAWYAWSGTPALAECVQAWLDAPGTNHGWILIGDETQASAKRFDSRQIIATDTAPRLVITFSPAPCLGDLNGDGAVGLSDLAILLSAFGNTTPGSPADIDQDGEVGLPDLTVLLSRFGTACAP